MILSKLDLISDLLVSVAGITLILFASALLDHKDNDSHETEEYEDKSEAKNAVPKVVRVVLCALVRVDCLVTSCLVCDIW